MEGVAYRLALVYDRLAPLAAPGHEVIASGGALAHSRAWTAIMADVLGVSLTRAAHSEASARGAALPALERLRVRVAPPAAVGETFRPDPERHAIYRAARERHGRLYDTIVGPPPLLRE